MKFELYKDAVLTRDVPEHRLKRGDIVKLVDHHVARDGSESCRIGTSARGYMCSSGTQTP